MPLMLLASSPVTTDRPAPSRGALVAVVVLSLLLLAPASATVGAQETASPAASPASTAGLEFLSAAEGVKSSVVVQDVKRLVRDDRR